MCHRQEEEGHATLPDRNDLRRVVPEEARVVLDDVVEAPADDAQDGGQQGDVHQLVPVDAPARGVAEGDLDADVEADRDHDPVPMDLQPPDRHQYRVDPDLDQHRLSLRGQGCAISRR